jgi:hypothetical protein
MRDERARFRCRCGTGQAHCPLAWAPRPSLPLGTQGHLPECPECSNSTQLIRRSQVGSTGRRRRRFNAQVVWGWRGAASGPGDPARAPLAVRTRMAGQPRILQGRGPRPRPGGPLGLPVKLNDPVNSPICRTVRTRHHDRASSAYSQLTHRTQLSPIHLELNRRCAIGRSAPLRFSCGSRPRERRTV